MAVYEGNDANFRELIANGVSIVDFYSTHCGPCRVLLPVLLQLEAELPFINLVKINTDHCPKLAAEFQIIGLPTIYLCKDGVLEEYSGMSDLNHLRQAVGKILYE